MDSEEKNPEYDDVAMIVYSPKNKKTCFFQKLARVTTRGVPQERSAFAPVDAISGKDIPSPFGSNADKFWDDLDVVKTINCAKCHDANPFVRSPYACQVTKDEPNQLPPRSYGQGYGIVGLDEFGKKWKKYHAYFDFKDRKVGTNGACMKCHSLGPGLSSGNFAAYSAGKHPPNQIITSIFSITHWMPPEADQKTWEHDFRASVEALAACNKNRQSCTQVPLH